MELKSPAVAALSDEPGRGACLLQLPTKPRSIYVRVPNQNGMASRIRSLHVPGCV